MEALTSSCLSPQVLSGPPGSWRLTVLPLSTELHSDSRSCNDVGKCLRIDFFTSTWVVCVEVMFLWDVQTEIGDSCSLLDLTEPKLIWTSLLFHALCFPQSSSFYVFLSDWNPSCAPSPHQCLNPSRSFILYPYHMSRKWPLNTRKFRNTELHTFLFYHQYPLIGHGHPDSFPGVKRLPFSAPQISPSWCCNRTRNTTRSNVCCMKTLWLLRRSWLLSFIPLIWCIPLTDFQVLKQPCIPATSTTLSWCIFFFWCCWFSFIVICKALLCLNP